MTILWLIIALLFYHAWLFIYPAVGFVAANNAAPWIATLGPEAPRRIEVPESAGIETTRTNRQQRTLFAIAF